MSAARFDFSRPMPTALRVFLAAAGLFCIAMPAWEFRHAFIEPTLFSLFFGAIVLGAWSVGGAFVGAAVLGEAQTWSFSGGRLYVSRRSLVLDKTDVIDGREVESVTVREIDYDDRPHTFGVLVQTKAGKSYHSSEAPSREKAEALAAYVREKLRLR